MPLLICLALCTALAFLVEEPALTQVTGEEATCRWAEPTNGTPVDHYIVEMRINSFPWFVLNDTLRDNQFSFFATYGETFRIRVTAVDADDIHGPTSPVSDPFVASPDTIQGGDDEGPPGPPGQPIPD
jgi:hypothetical protein